MLVGEAVLEAVGSIALVAMYPSDQWSVDERLAGRIGTLLFMVQDIGFG